MKLSRIFCLLLATVFCSATMPAQNTFTVGTAAAAPGQKATGTLEVPAGIDAAMSIPVVVFHGAKPGPVLALVSGAHSAPVCLLAEIRRHKA